ncbi:MAG: Calx-beta domain-containing protein [Chloroflexota bacterium]
MAALMLLTFVLPPITVVAHADRWADAADRATSLPPAEENVSQVVCAPRPAIQLATTKIGEKDFQVTVTAGRGNVELIRFGAAPTVRLDLPGRGTGITPPLDYKPPTNAPNATFVLHATGVGSTVTLPLTVFDGCGQNYPWPTFVGGGSGATVVQLSIADATVVEGDSGTSNMTFTVSLSSVASVPVTVGWSTGAAPQPGLAAASNSDYVSASGVLTFVPGETTKTIVVQIVGDLANEPTKTFAVTLANPTNASIGRGTAVGTIVDNDGLPSLSIDDKSLAEGNSGSQALQFTVTLSPPSGQTVTVQYATANDTATAGADYTATSGTLTFVAGQTTQPVSVQVTGDTTTEPNERFFVNLTNPTNATIVKSQGIGSIVNDDATPVVTLGVSGSPFSENGGQATVTATLSNPTTLPVTVDLGFGGSATQTTDYTPSATQITIPALQTTGSITLTGVNDGLFEGPETVQVTITGATNATVGSPNQVAATISEDDASPTVSWTAASQSVSEAVGAVTVTATLSAPAALDVTVPFTVGGTATQGVGQDFTLTPNPLVIPAGQTSASVTVTVLDDSAGEPSETVTLQIGAPTNATVGAPSLFTLTIADNDGPVVTTTTGATAFTENGAAVVVDGGVTVTSPGVNLVSASVVITNPLDGAVESLASTAAAVPGITPSYDAPTHTLSFTGSGTAAQYQGLLQGVTYANTSDNPTTTARSISFQVTNVTLLSGSASKSVSIGASNDAPTLTGLEGTPLAYAENDPPTPITASLVVADVDSPTLASATVQLTGNCASGEDVLALTPNPQNGITGVYTAATCTLSLTGSASPASYQTALRAVTYANTSNNPSTLARTVSFTVNDGTANSTTVTRSITVGNANDAPVVTPSGATAPTFTEGDPPVLVDGGITVTDPDSATLASATITLTTNPDSSSEGLDVDLTGLVGLTKGGSGTATLTLTGPAAPSVFQTALQRVTYSNSSQAPTAGSRTVSFVANDGAVNSTTATASVTVIAVDDPPVNTVPGAQNVNQGGVLTLSTGNANAISIADLDAGSSAVQVTLTATNGTLSLSGTAGLAFTAGDGTADATMTFTGAISAINTALNGLTFTPTAGYSGAASIQIVTDDLGNTGTGGPLSDTDSVSITVVAQNQPPVNSVPGTQSVAEDGTLTFSSGNSNLISISDSDAGANTVQVALTATNGTLTLSGTAGLDFAFAPDANGSPSGDGTADATMTFRGTIAAVNTALSGLTFAPTANYNGPASVQIVTNDLGNSGPGGAKTDDDTVSITVTAVNDAPVLANLEGTAVTYAEGAPAVAVTSAITVTDIDSATLTGGTVRITAGCATGEDALDLPFQASGIIGGYSPATCTLTLSGSASPGSYQTALRAVRYLNTNAANPSTATRTLTFQVNDGAGANHLSNQPTRDLTVTAVNDPPVLANVEGAALTVTEGDAAKVVTSAITVTDPDGATLVGGTVQITGNCTPAEDVLALPGSPLNGVTGVYTAATCTLALSGTTTLANYETALRAVTYLNSNTANPSTASRTLTFQVDDGQAANNLSNQPTRSIAVTAVDDAPVITRPATVTATEDQTFTFNVGNTISVADVDAASGSVQATLTVTNGTLTLSGTAGLSFSFADANGTGAGDGTADATMTFRGTLSNVNAALNGMTYKGNANFNGSDTLSIGVNDLGNTGTGGPLTDSKSVGITVTPVNDAPTANAFTNLPAQASIQITYPAGKLGGTDVEDGTAVTIDTTPGAVTNGTVVIRSDGSFDFTPDPDAAGGSASFTYRVADSGVDSTVSGPPLNSTYVTVSFSVAGPELYFVKTAAAGAGTCTLGNECTLATALTNIGSRTNVRIFVNDASTYSNTVTLTANSWLTSQGVTGTTFDSLFSISTPAQGTLATRPSLGQSRPTLSGAAATVTMNNSSQVRGVIINVSAGSNKGLVATNATGTLLVTDTDVTSAGGNAIDLSNTSVDFTGGGLAIVSTSGNGFEATSGGTVTVQGTGNTISTGSGIALNVSSTTIGASGLTFQSISANGGSNGIVLSSTGASGGLTVTGDGNTSVGGNNSGGTIQNTTGFGISLTTTLSPSFTNMNIQNTVGHGVGGTDVTNFTFNYGKVNNSQTDASSATEEANIGFYVNETNSTRNNLDGIVNIIGNQLTNAQFHGIDIFNFSGTITDLNIKSNTITSSTSVAASQGGGIRIVAFGSATTIANVTKASIDKNTVSNFPSGFGIEVQGGNGNLAGPSTGFVGHVGSATDVISITDNTVSGASAANRLGTFGITATVNGRGQGNFFIGDGDDVNTTGNSISNSTGNAINIGSFGFANVEAKIDANVVVAHTASGAAGIGAGTSIVLNSDETPTLTVTVTNNNVSQTDGNGILVTARDGKGTLNASIKNNTVAAPLGGARPGIRVDSGNGVNTNGGTENETTCLRISGNTTAGTGHTIAGIGLRKQGTSSSLNIFGIVGMSATSSPGVEQYVGNNGQNPGTENGSGDGSVDGVLLISAGSGFSNCSTAPP